MNATVSPGASSKGELWTLRGLLARHKMAGLAVLAGIALLLAMLLLAIFGSKAGAVTDATTCTQWGSANQSQQSAYARLYVREHGPLRGGATSPASVIAAINNGCTTAYGDDVSDNVTVVEAISGNF